MTNMKIDLNKDFKKALSIIEDSGKNIFITGKAGTGKSTFLTHLRSTTSKKMVYLAPTGVAAINIKGQTIHSFFRFKPSVTLDKVKKLPKKKSSGLYKKLDAIVIDEISMVRADLLDCVDKFMRLNGKNKDLPFGGTQMIFIGDLYQLPPVVTGAEREIFKTHYKSSYFFDANVFEDFNMDFIELEKIYRQSDKDFIEILNAIRNNSATDDHLKMINSRLNNEDEPDLENLSICLTTTNRMAKEINDNKLSMLTEKLKRYSGDIDGDFSDRALPTDEELELKVGSQVMMLNNDSEGRWVNGSVGRIEEIASSLDEDIIVIELSDGEIIEVTKHTWDLYHFAFNEASGKLVSESVGSFTQYPLTLAWAITIHKSQGKTFDKVIIDIGRGTFAHGQIYVALSRCTSLEGITLKRAIEKKHIFMDWRVVNFVTGYQYRLADAVMSVDEKVELIDRAIKDDKQLEVVYLKASDEKSTRIIDPKYVGEMEYRGKTYVGVRGLDSKSQSERNFKVDRILELQVAKESDEKAESGIGARSKE